MNKTQIKRASFILDKIYDIENAIDRLKQSQKLEDYIDRKLLITVHINIKINIEINTDIVIDYLTNELVLLNNELKELGYDATV